MDDPSSFERSSRADPLGRGALRRQRVLGAQMGGALAGDGERGAGQDRRPPQLASGAAAGPGSRAARRDAASDHRPAAGSAGGAKLWFLPPYSPDLNPIEQAFAKIKHWMRDAQKRTPEDASNHLAQLIETIQPHECRNYIHNAGYGSN